jgi:hypothetical protein
MAHTFITARIGSRIKAYNNWNGTLNIGIRRNTLRKKSTSVPALKRMPSAS